VAPGETSYVIVDDNTSYAKRYDMIAFICGDTTFPAVVFSPEDREARGVRGITKELLNESILNITSRYVGYKDRYPWYIICDKSTVHNKEEMLENFRDGGVHEIVEIVFMPTKAAKRLSPLDNGLFGLWKQRCRKRGFITKENITSIMISEWERISKEEIEHAYRHCGLTTSRNIYFDCPNPRSHVHA